MTISVLPKELAKTTSHTHGTGLTLRLDGVSFSYETRKGTAGNTPRILQEISLNVSAGSVIAIVGRSGCGKSTLLRLMAGLLQPSEGQISVGGAPPEVARKAGDYGFVFQDPELLPWRTLWDNIALPSEVGPKKINRDEIERFITLVGLGGFEQYYPANLSGGMRSRVAIARALVAAPRIVFMDESFADLDELTREQLALDFLNLVELRGTTVVFVTHNISEAAFIADQVFVLRGTPATIAEGIPVDLPRPRRQSHRETPEFFETLHRIRQVMGVGVSLL